MSELFKRIPANHDEQFHCLNFLHSFKTKNKPGKRKKVCENQKCLNKKLY